MPVIECFTERREIQVSTNASDKNATKTFMFDRVFGPETGQAHIYEEIVQPMIEEVILGYNCTIFALASFPSFPSFPSFLFSIFSCLTDRVLPL